MVELSGRFQFMLEPLDHQVMPRRPVFKSGLAIDVSTRPDVQKLASPIVRQPLGPLQGAVGVITAGQHFAAKRQLAPNHGPPVVKIRRRVLPLRIRRRHQPCAMDLIDMPGVRRPCRHQLAPQAVGHQHRRLDLGQKHFILPCHPVSAQRPNPFVLFNTGVSMRLLPAALPMHGIRVQPTRQQQDGGSKSGWGRMIIHGSGLSFTG